MPKDLECSVSKLAADPSHACDHGGEMYGWMDLPYRQTAIALLLAAALCAVARGGSPGDEETLVVRLNHPERQAAQILKLFEGSRAPHPAAALAAWKNAARQPDQLGKPLQALIAVFNPEMANEWRLMHGAELIVNWNPVTGE